MNIIDTIELFISGDWGEETYSDNQPCKVACIRGVDIVPINDNYFGHIPTRYISRQSFEAKCLKAGDIVVEKSGGSPTQSTGRVAFISQELIDTVGAVVCTNFCVAFRVKKKWNPRYVFYYLQNVYNNGVFFNFEGKTSGLKNLQLETAYKAIPIEDIDKMRQDKVVGVLDSIQRKIAINRSLNQNLEAMTKQLYDYWFVQFDFPNEEGKPYKSSGGKMVWNEKLKREMPERWMVLPLFEGVEVQYGFPFSTDLFVEERTNIPIVRIRDILEGSISAYSTEEPDDKYRLHKGDVVIGMDGNFHMNYWHTDTAFLNQRSVRLRVKNSSTISAIQIFHNVKPYIKAKELNAKGSTVGHLSDNDLKGLYILEAPMANNFNPRAIFDAMLDKMLTNRSEIMSLIKQRDELLPLLMNGQVSVNSDLLHD